MPDPRNREDGAFAKYDVMSTDELQQILREDASKPEGEESDPDALFYIMEVLAKRRKQRNEGKSPEEALGSFKEKYHTENNVSFDPEGSLAEPKRRGAGRWMRGVIAAAAMLVFIIGGSLTARAMGFDLWEIIARWTQETLHLGYSEEAAGKFAPSSDFMLPCASLQEAIDDCEITAALVPTWIPDGYEEVDVQTEETPMQRRIVAKYQSGKNKIRIRIVDYMSSAPVQVEQSDSLIEVYPSNDIDYYIFSNYEELKAVWINGKYECYIIGPLTVSEIEKMIDSIEKG